MKPVLTSILLFITVHAMAGNGSWHFSFDTGIGIPGGGFSARKEPVDYSGLAGAGFVNKINVFYHFPNNIETGVTLFIGDYRANVEALNKYFSETIDRTGYFTLRESGGGNGRYETASILISLGKIMEYNRITLIPSIYAGYGSAGLNYSYLTRLKEDGSNLEKDIRITDDYKSGDTSFKTGLGAVSCLSFERTDVVSLCGVVSVLTYESVSRMKKTITDNRGNTTTESFENTVRMYTTNFMIRLLVSP